MEPVPAPESSSPPPSASRFPWPIVIFLVLAIAGGAGAVAIQWSAQQKQVASSQNGSSPSSNAGAKTVPASLANGAVEPTELDLGASGVLSSGEGDQVVIYGVLGSCEGHMQLRDLLTKFGDEYSSQAKVVLFSGLGSPDGQRAIGASCAGYVVAVRDGEGVLRPTASFQKAPGMGWTVEEVMEAAGKAVAQASGGAPAAPEPETAEGSGPSVAGSTPSTDSGTDGTPTPAAAST